MASQHYDREIFFDVVREGPFPGRLIQDQVDGMESILDAWEETPFDDRRWLAYCLATAKAETGNMKPVVEAGMGRGHPYGQPHEKTGKVYAGRGLVQITWHGNYAHATEQINSRDLVGRQVDLVNNPEQALEPDISATILFYGCAEGWFTNHKLSDFFNDQETDWLNARKIVNAMDRAREIAGDARDFHKALNRAATEAEPKQPEQPVEPERPEEGAEVDLSNVPTEAMIDELKRRYELLDSFFQ